MVDAAVTYLLQKLDAFLIEGQLLYELRHQVEWVATELRRMQCFLKDADQRRNEDERVSNWINEIRDITHHAEDVIDMYMLRVELPKGQNSLMKRSSLFLQQLMARRAALKEIQSLRMKISEIARSRDVYGLKDIGISDENNTAWTFKNIQTQRRLSPHLAGIEVVGFEEELKQLTDILTTKAPHRLVLSIVGMGGLGKTTLALQLYNNSSIQRHFDCHVWVNVSQECRTGKQLLIDVTVKTACITRDSVSRMSQQELEEMLYNFLKVRKYLVVLDDVWRTEIWQSIRAALPDVNNGSRVLLTTRFLKVGLGADPTTPPHKLRFLSQEESWDLFRRSISFPSGDTSCVVHPEVESIGKEIVRQCHGLPMAIKVLAGVLSTKERTTVAWSKVLQSIKRQLTNDPSHCSEILALSYYDLPYHLKFCFLYFGLFPEDFEIPTRRLLTLWIAEGFVQEMPGETIEDVAERYLEELVGRSLVQVVKWNSYGGIKTCKIHDLLRDVCITEASQMRLYGVFSHNTSVPHRFCLRDDVAQRPLSSSLSFPLVRTFICFNYNMQASFLESFLRCFKLLKVLDLEGVCIHRLPSEIGEMLHLRHLGMRRTALKELPGSTANLRNLQTLDLRWTYVRHVPEGIWRIQKLRHLYFDRMHPQETSEIDDLCNIQTLSVMKAGRWLWDGLFKMVTLRRLNNCGILSSDGQMLTRSLESLSRLQKLGLSGEVIPNTLSFSSCMHLHVLYLGGTFVAPSSTLFPPNLTKLTLKWSSLNQEDLASLEMLPNLRILRLWNKAYSGKHMIFSSQAFRRLEELELFALFELEDWIIEKGAMNNLRRLAIFQCHRLNMLPPGLVHLSFLQELKIWDMPIEFNDKIRGDDAYKVWHIPSMTISNLFN